VTVDAGARVQIEFRSNDAAPHNFAIYETAAAEVEVFVGDIVIGPREVELYEFDAPLEPGTYFFRCDVHPIEMIGDFVVL
jgi:plastocyanin